MARITFRNLSSHINRLVNEEYAKQLRSAADRRSAARENPESRMATRALGDRSELGITDSLTLGAAPPSVGVRPVDVLISDFRRTFSRKWKV